MDEGIKHAPELYKFGTSKIKNKNFKTALESDIANYAVKDAKKKQLRTYLVKEKNEQRNKQFSEREGPKRYR